MHPGADLALVSAEQRPGRDVRLVEREIDRISEERLKVATAIMVCV
jgi:hypothetical protein